MHRIPEAVAHEQSEAVHQTGKTSVWVPSLCTSAGLNENVFRECRILSAVYQRHTPPARNQRSLLFVLRSIYTRYHVESNSAGGR